MDIHSQLMARITETKEAKIASAMRDLATIEANVQRALSFAEQEAADRIAEEAQRVLERFEAGLSRVMTSMGDMPAIVAEVLAERMVKSVEMLLADPTIAGPDADAGEGVVQETDEGVPLDDDNAEGERPSWLDVAPDEVRETDDAEKERETLPIAAHSVETIDVAHVPESVPQSEDVQPAPVKRPARKRSKSKKGGA